MSKLSRLTLCLLSIVMVSIPLFDILSNIMDLNRINVISIAILFIILISLLICSALWLYIEWRDFSEEEQLHRERLKYTSPDLLGEQTKVCLGLHNSSSLYKITNFKVPSKLDLSDDVKLIRKRDEALVGQPNTLYKNGENR